MAKFTNDPNPTNDPDYLKQFSNFSELKGNTALGNLFANVGEIGTNATNAAATLIKQDAQDFLYKKVDEVRKNFGVDEGVDVARQMGTNSKGQNPLGYVDEASSSGGGLFAGQKGPIKGAPAGVQKVGDRITRLHEAYDQGQMSDSYYYSNLEAVMKEARARYPGFREDLDQMAQSITGVIPANALRKSLLSDLDNAQRAANAQGAKWQQFMISNGPEIAALYGEDGARAIAMGTPSQTQQADIYAKVMSFKAVNVKNEQIIKKANALKDTRSVNQDYLFDTVAGYASVNDTTTIGQITNATELMDGRKLTDVLQDVHAKGLKSDPKLVQAAISALEQSRLKARSSLDAYLDQTDDNGRSLRVKLGPRVDDLYKQQDARFAHMKSSLGTDDMGALHTWKLATNLNADITTNDLVQQHPAWGFLINNGSKIGDTASAAVMMRPDLKMLPDIQQFILKLNMKGMGTPDPKVPEKAAMSLKDALQFNQRTGGPTLPRAQRLQINAVGDALLSQDVPVSEKLTIADAAYSDLGYLRDGTFKTDKDKMKAWYRLTTPAITNEMLTNVGPNDPQKNKDYERFVLQGGSDLVRDAASRVQASIEGRTDLKVTYNQTANQFEWKRPGFDYAGAKKMGLRTEHDTTVLAINDINAILANVAPVLKNQGVDAGAWMKGAWGIDPDAPPKAQPNVPEFMKAAWEKMQSAAKAHRQETTPLKENSGNPQ